MIRASWKSVFNYKPHSSSLSILFLLLTILLFAGCGDRKADTPSATPGRKYDWEGSPNDFRKTFSISTGRFIYTPDKQPFTGVVSLSGTPAYTLEIRDGLPVRFIQKNTGTPIDRWDQEACWIGIDGAWEEDFRETENGLFYVPENQLFTGKVFSIDAKNGQILVEYTYVAGISHGPEIYYDEEAREESRINWVNGIIPFQKL